MRQAIIKVNGVIAGRLEEISRNQYRFIYESDYKGSPVSLTLPLKNTTYDFDHFPTFFEGLLPEGVQLEALLRRSKLDKKDCFGQLLRVGQDLVGAVTVEEPDEAIVHQV